jgi:fructose-bisphosphate aldolase class II
MPLVQMKDMLLHAHAHRYAVGAFDLVSLDFLEGILAAAERCRAPVILSLAESHSEYFDFELLMPAVETAARRASVPVAIHLDHGTNLGSAVSAINRGCNGVMVDASDRPFDENLCLTREVVAMAHACGVPVEGELGYVPGVEGEDAERDPGEIAYTTVGEAKIFVDETGVDFLAVSIGTLHGRMRGEPKLDHARLQQIKEKVGIPLVIHGGTGLSDDQFRRLIANGVAKINYYTALDDAAGAAIRKEAGEDRVGGYTSLVRGVQEAIANEVERCIRLWGSAGHAAEVLAECAPWLPVEHLTVYNVEGCDSAGVQAMIAEGRRVLEAIPACAR